MSRGDDIDASLVLETALKVAFPPAAGLLLNQVLSDGSVAPTPVEVVVDPSDEQVRAWTEEWRHFADDDEIGRATADWDWVRKPALVAPGRFCQRMAVVADDQAQGLILVSAPEASRVAPPSMTLYAEYIESAPWNRHDLARKHPLFKGVGTLLLYLANYASLKAGFDGGFCLHSLPTAEAFYEHRGMTKCRHEICEDGKRMWLFEFEPAAAEAFAASMR